MGQQGMGPVSALMHSIITKRGRNGVNKDYLLKAVRKGKPSLPEGPVVHVLNSGVKAGRLDFANGKYYKHGKAPSNRSRDNNIDMDHDNSNNGQTVATKSEPASVLSEVSGLLNELMPQARDHQLKVLANREAAIRLVRTMLSEPATAAN